MSIESPTASRCPLCVLARLTWYGSAILVPKYSSTLSPFLVTGYTNGAAVAAAEDIGEGGMDGKRGV